MRRTEETKTGINWTDEKVLGDLDFSEDVCLLNSSVEEMQTKTNCLSSNANKVGTLHQCLQKTLSLNDKALADVNRFTYLIISKVGDCSVAIKNRLGKHGENFKNSPEIGVQRV